MNRLYQNGIISSGEPRHFNEWDFPSVPRLEHRLSFAEQRPARRRVLVSRGRQGGLLTQIFNVLRSR